MLYISFRLCKIKSFSSKNVKYRFSFDFDVKYLDICVISHFFLKKCEFNMIMCNISNIKVGICVSCFERRFFTKHVKKPICKFVIFRVNLHKMYVKYS
jgi:hypothetical protein